MALGMGPVDHAPQPACMGCNLLQSYNYALALNMVSLLPPEMGQPTPSQKRSGCSLAQSWALKKHGALLAQACISMICTSKYCC